MNIALRLRLYRPSGAVAAAIMAFALLPHTAAAALGETEATVAADADEMHASIKSTAHGNYRVHTIALPSGTVLREFASPQGTVFAVAWNGPVIPDLRQTLGRYFATFTAAAAAPHAGHRHLQVTQDGFVMQSSGHMRAFTGRAYLPPAIPAGVSLDDVH